MNTTTPKWKQFEENIFTYLTEKESVSPIVVHRFYDTHSAGSFLPAQPGDFLIITEGRAILLEAKHSTKYMSLRSCFSTHMKDSQIGQHTLWQRAGATTLVIFKSETKEGGKQVELWDGKNLIKSRNTSTRLRIGSCLKIDKSLKVVIDWALLCL